MKHLSFVVCLILFIGTVSLYGAQLTPDFANGTPDIKSMHALTFGPEGILFVGDSKGAAIFAVETKDTETKLDVEDIEVERIDKMIATALGTEVANISIQDMAVNPLSKKVYFAVHYLDGTPVLLSVEGGKLGRFDLSDVSYSKMKLPSPVGEDDKDRRGRPLRRWAISDIDYFGGRVLVSGLSNKEFSSAMSMFPFPFQEEGDLATLEIWHAAHGQYETHAPIKTFTTTLVNGEPHVIASYTCTPLVLFPLNMLKEGKHIEGRTVAELGNRNTPLDIISMEKEGKSYLLMANTSRALMKISYDDLEAFGNSITEPVGERGGTAGVEFLSLPLVYVQQLDKLDDHRFLMLQRMANGDLNLHTGSADRWL